MLIVYCPHSKYRVNSCPALLCPTVVANVSFASWIYVIHAAASYTLQTARGSLCYDLLLHLCSAYSGAVSSVLLTSKYKCIDASHMKLHSKRSYKVSPSGEKVNRIAKVYGNNETPAHEAVRRDKSMQLLLSQPGLQRSRLAHRKHLTKMAKMRLQGSVPAF